MIRYLSRKETKLPQIGGQNARSMVRAEYTSAPRTLNVVLALAGISLASGCGAPQAKVTELDSQDIASRAIKAYDTDQNGVLDAKELRASLSLSEALSRIDKDKNGRLSTEEIAARLESYKQHPSSNIGFQLKVTKAGYGVENAEVAFVPEPFMGEQRPTYSGTTDDSGTTWPTADPSTGGVAVGFYVVTITLPDGTTNNSGFEVAHDIPSINRPRINL